jgi:H+/Cl- antiporter ClcA
MQIKTTLRFHLIPVRIAIATPLTTGVGEDVGKKEPSYTVGGNVN